MQSGCEELDFVEEPIESPVSKDRVVLGSVEETFDVFDEEHLLPEVSISQCSYETLFDSADEYLFLASRGGTGHVTAMMAILELFPKESLRKYTPLAYHSKSTSMTGLGIHCAALFNQLSVIKDSLTYFGIVAIPEQSTLASVIAKYHRNSEVYFIDMLLDVLPIGYESAAIWDEFQRNDQCEMLTRLVDLQAENDRRYYGTVSQYFFEMLQNAHYEKKPYTKIISTQVLGLPALCDAVIRYNNWLETVPGNTVPPVVIEQFLTDLPTTLTTHYFNTLRSLERVQKQQINLHAVHLTKKVLVHFFGERIDFKAIYDIDPKKNPMVRGAFRSINNTRFFDQAVELCCKDGSVIHILAHEHVATIMLGGQAGNDTVRYVEPFLENGIDKVFIFGGDNPKIREAVTALLLDNNYLGKIILLPHQDATFIAGLQTRSRWIVTRAGGLSCFEQLAMSHHLDQIIFIHHADSCDEHYDCGIPWENGNANMLIHCLVQQGFHVEKIRPKNLDRRLKQLRGLTDAQIEDMSWISVQNGPN